MLDRHFATFEIRRIPRIHEIRATPWKWNRMSTPTIITMIAIVGFIWGGFAVFLGIALRKESEKG